MFDSMEMIWKKILPAEDRSLNDLDLKKQFTFTRTDKLDASSGSEDQSGPHII